MHFFTYFANITNEIPFFSYLVTNSWNLLLLVPLRVHVDQFINNGGWPKGLGWDGLQAQIIIKRWKQNGMNHEDIGYLSDADELFSRDYIRAMQICDVKEFDEHGNCNEARISASALVFEGGPECRTERRWQHPDLTIGECVEGINDSPSQHATPERGWQGTGWLDDGYTKQSRFHKLPKNTTHYPLFNAHDYRRVGGSVYRGSAGYNAFHIHNTFTNATTLRNKYLTYPHPVKDAMEMPLSEIHDDVKTMKDCAFNTTSTPATKYKLVGLRSLTGPIPLAFQIDGYIEGRMAELKDMLEIDDDLKKEGGG